MATVDVEEYKNKLRGMFPYKYSDNLLLNLITDEIDVVYINKSKSRKYYLNLIDQDGYKYYFEYSYLKRGDINAPSRFFKRNKYTYDNINLFCRLNDIDLQIDGTNLPIAGFAREKLKFMDSSGEIIRASWDQVRHYYYQYQRNYNEVKKENFENRFTTKEEASLLVLKAYNELKRPLLQRDFENQLTTETTIGIRVIWRIWGTFTNMIRDLNLPEHDSYYKPFSPNYRDHNNIMNDILLVCNNVKNEGRNVVLVKDFEAYSNTHTYKRHCKLEGKTLNEVIKSNGCEFQKSGCGMNHTFPDGEKVSSQYEYEFSMFLRKSGLDFNKDYIRDVCYNQFDKIYKGKMNCDYKITIGNRKIFVELAGILGNKEYQVAYENNIIIKSKSKELYRQKLNEKREMFERNNLEYYILLPKDINEENFINILNNSSINNFEV